MIVVAVDIKFHIHINTIFEVWRRQNQSRSKLAVNHRAGRRHMDDIHAHMPYQLIWHTLVISYIILLHVVSRTDPCINTGVCELSLIHI